MSSTHIIIHGAAGRMGQRIEALARADSSLTIDAKVVKDHSSSSHNNADGFKTLTSLQNSVSAAVIIDFSHDSAIGALTSFAIAHKCAILTGTTALSDGSRDALKAASMHVPVMITSNTSAGVAALALVLEKLAASLGENFTFAITETHHDRKKDAPSGTALRLASAIRTAGGKLSDEHIQSIRAGDVVGTHTIVIHGPSETLELTHRATSRDVFAHGALRAAKWLAKQRPGLYTIDQALGSGTRER
jgi:4-hydroxy-tetrahydrodipicolinate reductase